MNRSRVALLAAILACTTLAAHERASFAAGEKDAIAAELVKAAGRDDAPRLAAALDKAVALVGKDAALPDLFAVAEWIGTLPGSVSSHQVVRVRRGWMYLTAKRASDAVLVLEPALAAAPRDGVARAYLGEARRQTGESERAATDLGRALADGAPSEFVLPSISKLLFDLRRDPAPASGLPSYATVAALFLAEKDVPEVHLQTAKWLAFDAERVRGDAARGALLYGAAVKHAWAVVQRPPEGFSVARTAYHASEWRRAMGGSAPADVPDRYDLLAEAVRAGAAGQTDEVPEALAALAELALAEGRYALAHAMAKRRLSISDSPSARRVLLGLPPDVGR